MDYYSVVTEKKKSYFLNKPTFNKESNVHLKLQTGLQNVYILSFFFR